VPQVSSTPNNAPSISFDFGTVPTYEAKTHTDSAGEASENDKASEELDEKEELASEFLDN